MFGESINLLKLCVGIWLGWWAGLLQGWVCLGSAGLVCRDRSAR